MLSMTDHDTPYRLRPTRDLAASAQKVIDSGEGKYRPRSDKPVTLAQVKN